MKIRRTDDGESLGSAMLEYKARQDAAREDWESRRLGKMPNPPFPDPQNPVLEYLVREAERTLAAGDDSEGVVMHLAVHAWFEGGVEGYDRGRTDCLGEH